jgi:hypothetical protein
MIAMLVVSGFTSAQAGCNQEEIEVYSNGQMFEGDQMPYRHHKH